MMSSHHYEHSEPIMMPYNMEYAIPSHSYHGGEMAGNELYSLHVPAGHEAIAQPHHIEGVAAAESTVNQVVNLQNATNGQTLAGLHAISKVKRQDRDIWAGN